MKSNKFRTGVKKKRLDLIEDEENGRFQNLTPFQIAILYLLGSVLLIPILFVVLTPEGGSVVLAIAGFGMMERVYDHYKKQFRADWQAKMVTGIVLILAFGIATGLMVLMMTPICRWLFIQETIEIQFLNRELIYGLALCYEIQVDYVTLGFGAYVHYLLMATFYLIWIILSAPFKWIGHLRRNY